MATCYTIMPQTKEYRRFNPASKCEVPIHTTCEHYKHGEGYYPAFDIGLEEPFVILLGLCGACAAVATLKTILTDERWRRMKMILVEHDVEIPNRRTIKMEMASAIYHPRSPSFDDLANSYAYALAA